MSDLRDKINGLVMVAADCFASPSQGDIERCGKITDRILALLPKVKPSCDARDAVASAVQSWEAQKRAASGREATPWPHICEQSRQVYLFEADKIIDSLAVAGYRITKTGDEPSLPKVPELRLDKDGRLFCGPFFVGSTGDLGEGCHQGYIVDPDVIEWCNMVAEDEATEPEARAAVEVAVRKALGWEA